MEQVIKTYELSKKYDYTTALCGVSLNVKKGAIYGLVGKNGAGKTTLMRVLCGLQKQSDGEYELFGIKSSDKRINTTRRRVGAVVEAPSLYLDMSAEDNLRQQCMILGISSDERIAKILDDVGLSDVGKKRVRDFSLGMRQRLGLAIALIGRPELVILDEPINGLDPYGIIDMRELIVRLNRDYNITFLISSHLLDELAKIATHYGFLNGGKLVREIAADEISELSRKRLRITLSNARAASVALYERGIEYKLISDIEADIYGDISVSELSDILSNAGCEMLTCTTLTNSLESYFINLIGGDENV